MDARALTVEFNEHINNGDLDGLAKLMTDDHTFIDTADHVIRGKRRRQPSNAWYRLGAWTSSRRFKAQTSCAIAAITSLPCHDRL